MDGYFRPFTFKFGGAGAIRTHDWGFAGPCVSHFTTAPYWWAHSDSNGGPGGYEPPALTN